jgi:hypothetical protein
MRIRLRNSENARRPWRNYNLAEFGLDPHVLRACFARYTDTFGVAIKKDTRDAGAGILS